MSDYEKSRRNHPSQRAADKRTLEEMEARYQEDAPEPEWRGLGGWLRKRGETRRKPKYRNGPAMRWRY